MLLIKKIRGIIAAYFYFSLSHRLKRDILRLAIALHVIHQSLTMRPVSFAAPSINDIKPYCKVGFSICEHICRARLDI